MYVISTETLNVDLRELSFFSDEATAFRSIKPYLEQALEVIKGHVQRKLPVGYTGNLGRSVVWRVFETEHGIAGRVYVPEDASGEDPDSKPGEYAYYVEFGREPGPMPPWDYGTPLFNWVGFKLVAEVTAMSKNSLDFEKAQRSLSFLVARKIGIYGTKAQMPFALGFNAGLVEAQQLIDYGITNLFNQSV
jgi:hypothetical protein